MLSTQLARGWGSSGVRHVFKTENKWDGMSERERGGTCWRNQDGEIEGIEFLHVGRVCLRSGGEIKPGGRGCWTEGTKTDLRWQLEVALLASLLLGGGWVSCR